MDREYSEICTDYIEKLIKPHRLYDKDRLNAVLKKHEYELTLKCMLDLSTHYDILEQENEGESALDYRISKYGDIASDEDWQELSYHLEEEGLI